MLNSNKSNTTSIFSVQEIASLSLMVAACVVGRLFFQFIPNVQPMTTILLIITIQQGLRHGMIVTLLSLLITNLYLGMGVWTISQLVSYAIIILLTSLVSRSTFFQKYFTLQIIFSFIAGFLYGFIISLITFKMFGMTAFLPYYLQGLSFDFLHAAGNAGFYILLAPLLKKLFSKQQQKKD